MAEIDNSCDDAECPPGENTQPWISTYLPKCHKSTEREGWDVQCKYSHKKVQEVRESKCRMLLGP